jgi:hypothetical protein
MTTISVLEYSIRSSTIFAQKIKHMIQISISRVPVVKDKSRAVSYLCTKVEVFHHLPDTALLGCLVTVVDRDGHAHMLTTGSADGS